MIDVLAQHVEHNQQEMLSRFNEGIDIDDDWIVTANIFPSGKCQILSHYRDDVWQLPDSIFPIGASPSAKKINFTLLVQTSEKKRIENGSSSLLSL
jgi:hypothetical protein